MTKGPNELAQPRLPKNWDGSDNVSIQAAPPHSVVQGGLVKLKLIGWVERPTWVVWAVDGHLVSALDDARRLDFTLDTGSYPHGGIYITAIYGWEKVPPSGDQIKAALKDPESKINRVELGFGIGPPNSVTRLDKPESYNTADQALWVAIRNRASAISFEHYKQFTDCVLCHDAKVDQNPLQPVIDEYRKGMKNHLLAISGVDAYVLLRTATEAFLLMECGVHAPNWDKTAKNFDGGEHFIRETGTSVYDERQNHAWGTDKKAPVAGLEQQRLNRGMDLDEARRQLVNYLGHSKAIHQVLPYLDRVLRNRGLEHLKPGSPFCENRLLGAPLYTPCFIELIWCYWHEEGMLVQTLNAVALRFQNRRRGKGADPLTHFDLSPLRALSHLIWGWIQESSDQLTVARRAYEYDHQYGFSLVGKAVPKLNPVDSRTQFIEGFHTLLNKCVAFYNEDADTTLISDGFALLNALKEVHIILAEGAHNQFGDLAWTSRVNMMVQQWLLARPEMQDFLRGRFMVPYKEAWMGSVDTMKKLQGWSNTSVTHFSDLGVFGEQLLLSIRYGDWSGIHDQEHAKNWARYWKPEVQSYIHSYRAVTGVNLSDPDRLNFSQPSQLLAERLKRQLPN